MSTHTQCVARGPSDHGVSGADARPHRRNSSATADRDGGDADIERGRPAAQAQGINEKYYKRVESVNGEQAWRYWAFQFKSATKTANEAAYHLIETAEKEEKEIDDVLSLSEAERSLNAGIFNILGTLLKGEPVQMLQRYSSAAKKTHKYKLSCCATSVACPCLKFIGFSVGCWKDAHTAQEAHDYVRDTFK